MTFEQQISLDVHQSSIAALSFESDLGVGNTMFGLLNPDEFPIISFDVEFSTGFAIVLTPPTGELFHLSSGNYRLAIDLSLVEDEVDGRLFGSFQTNGYVRVELVDCSVALDPNWFSSDLSTGAAQSANGKWIIQIRGSSDVLTQSMTFSALRILFVHVASDNSVTRRTAPVDLAMSTASFAGFNYQTQ